MSNKKWRDEFFHECGRHGIPVGVATTILRHANTMQRAAEVDCSVSVDRVRGYWAARELSARKSIEAALDVANDGRTARRDGDWFTATYHGDPRGCVVKLVVRRWVGVGALRSETDAATIAVPGVGFTAAQIDRLSRLK